MKVLWLSVAELETRTTLQRSFGGLFLGLLYLSPRTESQTELKRSAPVEKLAKGLIGMKSLLSLNPNGALLLGLSANYGLTKPILQSAKKCLFFFRFQEAEPYEVRRTCNKTQVYCLYLKFKTFIEELQNAQNNSKAFRIYIQDSQLKNDNILVVTCSSIMC